AGAILSIGILISPAYTQAAGLTADQATVLINVVKASPSTPASAFINLITAFSGVTVNQATALITVVQSSPSTSASVFVPLLTSFTSDTSTTQTTTQPTTQTTTQSAVVKSPTCTLNVAYGPGGVAKKYGLTGTGYYDGSGSTYVEIHDGEPVTVSWASTNADYSQGPGGDKDLANGSATYYPGGDKAYVWNFYGNGGYTSCGVMVEVFPNPDIPACALTASKNTAVPGDQVTLSWTSGEDAIYASWVQDSTANVLGLPLDKLSDFGSQVITVAGKGYLTPTLSIFGKGGSSSCSTTLLVSPLPTCTLTSKPYMVTVGGKTTLTWTSQNATYATWQQDSSANVLGLSLDKLPVSGSQSIVVDGGKGNQTPTLLVYSSTGVGTCNTSVSIE
ncbi:MAG: hypothetical protein NUV60_03235, partial [Patescibacteria group bacterium]|nr:hypothetical protein [Patescibacteria group bacterium]